MRKLIEKVFAIEQFRFILVGVMNTIIGTSVMFISYNLFGLGYWISSALNYIIGSIFSYFANKYFTFKTEKKSGSEVIRFALNIAVCYGIAYGAARPVINMFLGHLIEDISILEQISMILGMGLFIVINYLGQKLFVFQKKTE